MLGLSLYSTWPEGRALNAPLRQDRTLLPNSDQSEQGGVSWTKARS